MVTQNEIGPVVLENSLDGPYGPRLLRYGPHSPVTTLGHAPPDSEDDPTGILTAQYARYTELTDLIREEFNPLPEEKKEDLSLTDRGDEILFALGEAVMNFAKYRNGLDEEKLIYLTQHPLEAFLMPKVHIWPWRSMAHLCFAINADGAPDYLFDPGKVRLSNFDENGDLIFGKGGRGHIYMVNFANLVAYDGERGLYLYFNLPRTHWIRHEKSVASMLRSAETILQTAGRGA